MGTVARTDDPILGIEDGAAQLKIAGRGKASNSGLTLLREARTKAQESYLSGVVYSTCRVDLSRYPEPGRYNGVEAHLHAVRQKPGDTFRAFISRFTKVRGTISRISNASIITAFRRGYVMRRCSRN